MRRAIESLGAGLVVAAALVLPAAPTAAGGGGGGCHEPTDPGIGETVTMAMNCFGPSTLWTDPGTTVRFVNKDDYPHTVTGSGGWGTGQRPLDGGDAIDVTFDEVGVYPYTCIYHPGMNGAIVVGDGKGAGKLAETAPVELAEEAADDGPAVGIPDAPSVGTEALASEVLPWSATILGVSVLTGGLGFSLGRRRRSRI